jgi:membrane associated rhomboid family serine protease
MLIPLRHENMQGRRWPVITFGIIALNVIAFLGTHWTIERESPELGQVKVHLLLLAASHPELKIPEKVQPYLTSIRKTNPALWKEAANPGRDVFDAWDARIRMRPDDDPNFLQNELDSLADQYVQLNSSSILSKYAFIPAHPTFMSMITACFLHGGWLHLIGNMWFLFLFGDNVEDRLGHFRYLISYLICGLAASFTHYLFNMHSKIPTVGASGAIAGVLGAYFLLFPTARVLTWVFVFVVQLPAWLVLGWWFVLQFLSGAATSMTYSGQANPVAVWAHVGGFLCGMLLVKIMPTRKTYYAFEEY